MTCYFRHLKQVFEKAGIEITQANKKEIDRIIHNIVNVKYKNCQSVWKKVKNRIVKNEADFASMLRDAWSKRQS